MPPGIGIVHQVNLEYLAKGVLSKRTRSRSGIYYPDTLVGTDSHTTMINGLGVVGWGVGGIEAEAGMLGQPVYFLTPDVVGVHLTGELREGVTATDLVLHITQMLRKAKVVGKFVEFYGEGAAVAAGGRSRHHRQHGARIRRDDGLLSRSTTNRSNYLRATGRSEEQCAAFEDYYKAQEMFGIPRKGESRLQRRSRTRPRRSCSRAWPGRSGRRTASICRNLATRFARLFAKPVAEGGYGKTPRILRTAFPVRSQRRCPADQRRPRTGQRTAPTDTREACPSTAATQIGETPSRPR